MKKHRYEIERVDPDGHKTVVWAGVAEETEVLRRAMKLGGEIWVYRGQTLIAQFD